MRNRVLKVNNSKKNIIGHYISSQFLINKIWDDGSRYIVKNPKSFKETLKICELTTNQVDRVVKPLTKTDLIAILFKISPIYKFDYQFINKYYSIKDLNYIIRYEIYKNSINDIFDISSDISSDIDNQLK